MRIYKDLLILTLLTIGLSLCAIKPVYASEEEITDPKSSSVETVKFQFMVHSCLKKAVTFTYEV